MPTPVELICSVRAVVLHFEILSGNRSGAIFVRSSRDGLQCGVQPVGCNGKKFALHEISTTQEKLCYELIADFSVNAFAVVD